MTNCQLEMYSSLGWGLWIRGKKKIAATEAWERAVSTSLHQGKTRALRSRQHGTWVIGTGCAFGCQSGMDQANLDCDDMAWYLGRGHMDGHGRASGKERGEGD